MPPPQYPRAAAYQGGGARYNLFGGFLFVKRSYSLLLLFLSFDGSKLSSIHWIQRLQPASQSRVYFGSPVTRCTWGAAYNVWSRLLVEYCPSLAFDYMLYIDHYCSRNYAGGEGHGSTFWSRVRCIPKKSASLDLIRFSNLIREYFPYIIYLVLSPNSTGKLYGSSYSKPRFVNNIGQPAFPNWRNTQDWVSTHFYRGGFGNLHRTSASST